MVTIVLLFGPKVNNEEAWGPWGLRVGHRCGMCGSLGLVYLGHGSAGFGVRSITSAPALVGLRVGAGRDGVCAEGRENARKAEK
jgi:hypothetical protein